MQVLDPKSTEFDDFDGEMSKNHRDAIPNNEHTDGMRHINMPSRDAMSRIISGTNGRLIDRHQMAKKIRKEQTNNRENRRIYLTHGNREHRTQSIAR